MELNAKFHLSILKQVKVIKNSGKDNVNNKYLSYKLIYIKLLI